MILILKFDVHLLSDSHQQISHGISKYFLSQRDVYQFLQWSFEYGLEKTMWCNLNDDSIAWYVHTRFLKQHRTK